MQMQMQMQPAAASGTEPTQPFFSHTRAFAVPDHPSDPVIPPLTLPLPPPSTRTRNTALLRSQVMQMQQLMMKLSVAAPSKHELRKLLQGLLGQERVAEAQVTMR